MLEGSALGVPLGSTGVLVIGSNVGILVESNDDDLIGSTLGLSDGYIFRIDEGTELVSDDGSFDDYNVGELEGLLLGLLIGVSDESQQ